MPRFHHEDLNKLTQDELVLMTTRVAHKFEWFSKNGYSPHLYQVLFHAMHDEGEDCLCRFRNLVAGRRGGKTLSAAWDLTYYLMHPEHWHWDAHRRESTRPLHAWVLTPDFASSGRAAMYTMRDVFRQCGYKDGVEYKENRGNRVIEFQNGGILEYKTAERPEQLVGAGLDLLWIDEAAVIPDSDAWNIARPALADREGGVITTTTPRGKNWFYEMFWGREALEESDIGSVEYRSIDNSYFPRREWEKEQRRYHPLMFKREYMASFDAMAGVELSGEWLRYYRMDDLPTTQTGENDLKIFLGVDPAISLSDEANHFAMALIGLSKSGQVYLLEVFKERLAFPAQLEIIDIWNKRYRPIYIGIEAVAYQAALAQMAQRMEGMPTVVSQPAKGKKEERIMAMAPLFKLGKVRIREEHIGFIDEWVGYDSKLKNPKDDLLDAVEIALRTAGALLPESVVVDDRWVDRPTSIDDEAYRAWKRLDEEDPYDEHLGAYFG